MSTDPAAPGEPQPTRNQQVAGNLMAASIGAAIGGPAGAIIGAAVAPGMVEVARKVTGEFARHRDQSAAGVVDAAATELGVDAEGIESKIHSTPGGMELAGEAIWAGWQTLNEQKVRALGRALANGLRDDGARIDQGRLIIAALADLEAPHIKLLDAMTYDDAMLGYFETIEDWANDGDGEVDRQRLYVTKALMAALHRHGLVETNEAVQNEESDVWRTEATYKELEIVYRVIEKMLNGREVTHADLRPVKHSREPDLTIKWRATEFGITCAQYLRSDDA